MTVPRVALAVAVLALAACASVDYRDVQRDFNAAVLADNVRSVDALGALAGSDAERLYGDVRARLTDERIRALDARLRPNAHALRAVAEWRTGQLAEARATAQAGLRLPEVEASPRDAMVLEMIPALVIDEELVTRFRRAERRVTREDYERYAADFAVAAAALQRAAGRARPATPDTIVSYLHLQRWRVLQNWKIVLSHLAGADALDAALKDAERRLGASLDAEIARELSFVPETEPLRRTMDALRLR